MTRRQHALRLLVIAVLAFCAGIWWWTSHSAPKASASKITAPAQRPAPAVQPAADLHAPAATDQALLAAVPMPLINLPLRDSLASLQLRADAGDSKAACRLGVELLRCSELASYPPQSDAFMVKLESDLEAKGDIDGANNVAMGRLLHARLRDACSAIPGERFAQAKHYVRQAALAGEPEAMIRYARGETLVIGTSGMGYMATREFDAWRREARPVLMRALQAGHPEAALLLADAHVGNGFHLAMLLPRDAVEAGASLALAHRLFGDDPALARGLVGERHGRTLRDRIPALDVDQTAAAEQMAKDWHEQNFQGRRLALADSTAALLPLHGWIDAEDGFPHWPGAPPPAPCAVSNDVLP